MTSMFEVEKQLLGQALDELLNVTATSTPSIHALRDKRNALQLASRYPDFVVWGPEVHDGRKIVMYVWRWENGEKEEVTFSGVLPSHWPKDTTDEDKPPTR